MERDPEDDRIDQLLDVASGLTMHRMQYAPRPQTKRIKSSGASRPCSSTCASARSR